MSEIQQRGNAWIWVGARLLLILVAVWLLVALFYALPGSRSAGGLAVGLSSLFILPFCLGAILAFAVDPGGQGGRFGPATLAAALLLVILAIAGAFFREGLICMVMLAPLWWGSAWLGGSTVRALHRRFRERARLHAAGLIVLPFALLLLGPLAANPTHHFEVRRSVVIEAGAERIWPHLLALEDLSETEGVWTIAQDVLRIPRPRSALVVGEGVGAVRLARWGEQIGFEEHVTGWSQNRHLAWRFVFPDDSIARHTDAHIGPDSEYLGIETGGYTLTPLADGRTRLTLTTRYRASSPANHYSAVWGEIILGGIQRNILTVVADRSEAEAG
ncbi:SRPBCC family protein [Maricaulis salignorans]|uniref:SRPBCC family protein n=1 Tax=Maricaulis salignorans TaxID=144026 RepID=UPI003A9503CD